MYEKNKYTNMDLFQITAEILTDFRGKILAVVSGFQSSRRVLLLVVFGQFNLPGIRGRRQVLLVDYGHRLVKDVSDARNTDSRRVGKVVRGLRVDRCFRDVR